MSVHLLLGPYHILSSFQLFLNISHGLVKVVEFLCSLLLAFFDVLQKLVFLLKNFLYIFAEEGLLSFSELLYLFESLLEHRLLMFICKGIIVDTVVDKAELVSPRCE